MFKPAQIAFNGSILDCVLVNISPGGVQVHLSGSADLPDLVALRLSGGDTFMPRRCWRTGARIGFRFAGIFPLDALDGLVGERAPSGV